MRLPEKFLKDMKVLLEEEYELFLDSYQQSKIQGLRINTSKISVQEFLKISPFIIEPIPWSQDGFYYREEERPGKHPFYHAGLYYIQEPSAMLPANVLDVQPGEKILDLCAAPGGKTVQMANALKGAGVLVTNEINLNRVKALIKNVELYGISNSIVTNEPPEKLKKVFEGYFDKILVDAPCSGEGMFRKDESMIKTWERHGPSGYVPIQENILEVMDSMLKPQGRIVYSTCTFSIEENEGVIAKFLEKHPQYQLLDIPKNYGFSPGKGKRAGKNSLSHSVRLWPHRLKGEGHYTAWMEKRGETRNLEIHCNHKVVNQGFKDFEEFVEINLNCSFSGPFEIHGEQLYQIPRGLPSLKGIKVLRSGLLLGAFKKNRFEPSQALAMTLKKNDVKRSVSFSSTSKEVQKYLKGETLELSGEKGWTLICVEDFPLGWAKQIGNMLKNEYPAAWRRLD
ncbi:MAG: RsmB/NOP family class I SAM-dependent RNA methyltransferase [Thermotaleaceae bacterium]